jgi:hypothetical protein
MQRVLSPRENSCCNVASKQVVQAPSLCRIRGRGCPSLQCAMATATCGNLTKKDGHSCCCQPRDTFTQHVCIHLHTSNTPIVQATPSCVRAATFNRRLKNRTSHAVCNACGLAQLRVTRPCKQPPSQPSCIPVQHMRVLCSWFHASSMHKQDEGIIATQHARQPMKPTPKRQKLSPCNCNPW